MANFHSLPDEIHLLIIANTLVGIWSPDSGPWATLSRKWSPPLKEDAESSQERCDSMTIEPMLGPSDLLHLMLACRRFHDLAKPLLYKFNKEYAKSSAVIWAAQRGSLATLESADRYSLALVEEFSDEEDSDDYISPLHFAVSAGHCDTVTWLLDHGGSVDDICLATCDCMAYDVDAVYVEPFHVALCRRRPEIAILLLSRGAPLKYLDSISQPSHALLDVCLHGLQDVLQYLVQEQNVDPLEVEVGGLGPLQFAAQSRCDDTAMVKTLLDMGVNVHGREDLFYWENSPLSLALGADNFSIASLLLEAGASIDPKRVIPGRTASWHPTPLGDCLSVSMDGGRRDPAKQPAKQPAKRRDMLLQLLAAGADVNENENPLRGGGDPWHQAPLRGGGEPLHQAIRLHWIEGIEILLRAGATITNDHIQTAFSVFTDGNVSRGVFICLRTLMKYGARIERLLQNLATIGPDNEVASRIIQHILEHASNRNVGDECLVSLLDDSLRRNCLKHFIVIARYAPWTPSATQLYQWARTVVLAEARESHADQVSQDPELQDIVYYPILQKGVWPQVMNILLSYRALGDPSLCLLVSVAIQCKSDHALYYFLERKALDPPACGEFLPGLFTLALRLGNMAVIKWIWRSMSVVQLHPDFILQRLREAVLYSNFYAASFLVEHGADPFEEFGHAQRQRMYKSFGNLMTTARLGVEVQPGQFCQPYNSLRRGDYMKFAQSVTAVYKLHADDDLSPFQLAVRNGEVDIARFFLNEVPLPDSKGAQIEACSVPHTLDQVQASELLKFLKDKGVRIV